MSTTFQVIPTATTNITFRQVIELAERRMNAFFDARGMKTNIKLKINLHENREKYVHEIDLDSVFRWDKNQYVWFTIENIVGGTDAYCEELKSNYDDSDPWWRLEDMLLNNTTIHQFELKLEKAKVLNQRWSFRRSAGQPALINLAYGIISASIAELTNGFIWSDDGAWSFKKFPAEPSHFYDWYFKPEKEEDEGFKDWAIRNLASMERELNEEKT